MVQEQVDKIRDYLLAQGQQELVGHFDGMVQEWQKATGDTHQATEKPDGTATTGGSVDEREDPKNSQEFQDRAGEGQATEDTKADESEEGSAK